MHIPDEPTIPAEDRLDVYAELHWRSRTPRESQAFDAAVADPNVRDIAPLMVLRYSGPHAAEAAADIWEAPTREHFPTLEVPHDWIADFRDHWQSEVRLWPGALCILGELPDGRWQIALVSDEPRAITFRPGKPLMFEVVEHRVAWKLHWHLGAFVYQPQWTRMHPDPERRATFEDLFNRSGWFFVQPWDEDRPYGVLAVNRLEVVRADRAVAPAAPAPPTATPPAPDRPPALSQGVDGDPPLLSVLAGCAAGIVAARLIPPLPGHFPWHVAANAAVHLGAAAAACFATVWATSSASWAGTRGAP